MKIIHLKIIDSILVLVFLLCFTGCPPPSEYYWPSRIVNSSNNLKIVKIDKNKVILNLRGIEIEISDLLVYLTNPVASFSLSCKFYNKDDSLDIYIKDIYVTNNQNNRYDLKEIYLINKERKYADVVRDKKLKNIYLGDKSKEELYFWFLRSSSYRLTKTLFLHLDGYVTIEDKDEDFNFNIEYEIDDKSFRKIEEKR